MDAAGVSYRSQSSRSEIRMIARWLPLAFCAALTAPAAPAAAQTARYVLKGDSVAVYNLVGELRVEPGSGSDVSVQVLSFETGSGNVDVALTATFRSLAIETGSGDVTLRVPPTIGAEVELDAGSGDIDLGGLTIQVRRIQEDRVTGTIGDGRGRLSIETGSGNVRLVQS